VFVLDEQARWLSQAFFPYKNETPRFPPIANLLDKPTVAKGPASVILERSTLGHYDELIRRQWRYCRRRRQSQPQHRE
jgi:hypothetical protein